MRVQARRRGEGRIFLYPVHTRKLFFYECHLLKGTVPRDFWLRVCFHESVSPKPLSIFLKNRGEICISRYTTGVVDNGGKWKKSSVRNFNYFIWTPLASRVNKQTHFSFKFNIRWTQSDIVPIIWLWCHWHQWQIYCRCHWYWQQFTTGIIDWWCCWYPWQICHRVYLPPVSLTLMANLPLMSMIPVVHLDLGISPQIFWKIWNDPNIIFQVLGGRWFMKKTWTLSL